MIKKVQNSKLSNVDAKKSSEVMSMVMLICFLFSSIGQQSTCAHIFFVHSHSVMTEVQGQKPSWPVGDKTSACLKRRQDGRQQ